MKVRIVKCSRYGWWYEDQIGEIFNIHGEDSYDDEEYPDEIMCYTTLDYNKNGLQSWILKEDCEIVNEDTPKYTGANNMYAGHLQQILNLDSAKIAMKEIEMIKDGYIIKVNITEDGLMEINAYEQVLKKLTGVELDERLY